MCQMLDRMCGLAALKFGVHRQHDEPRLGRVADHTDRRTGIGEEQPRPLLVVGEYLGHAVGPAPDARIDVVTGGTNGAPHSDGTFGSRSTIFAGSAVHDACEKLIARGVESAAALFEFGDASYENGIFTAGEHHRVGWSELLQGAGREEIRVEGTFHQAQAAIAFITLHGDLVVVPNLRDPAVHLVDRLPDLLLGIVRL